MSLDSDTAFNNVSLEERLSLVAASQAWGFVAFSSIFALSFPVAIGFDNIYILAVGATAALVLSPGFSSKHWRTSKAKLTMMYLAARSVGRRLAYSYKVNKLDVEFVFRGQIITAPTNPNKAVISLPGLEKKATNKPVKCWICLLEGALVFFSEQTGGASLEFITPINRDLEFQVNDATEDEPKKLVVTASGFAEGHTVEITSKHAASLYVFEKKMARLIIGCQSKYQRALESLQEKEAATAKPSRGLF